MLKAALDQLAQGRVVAIATESFFGLLADVTSTSAVDELLSLKPRGSDKGSLCSCPIGRAGSL